MNLFELQDVCKDNLSVLDYLKGQKIIHTGVYCDTCHRPYCLVKQSGKLSGYVKQSVLKDSFLEGAHVSPKKFLFIVYYWATQTSLQTMLEHLDLSPNTGVDYYNYLRDICSWKLLQTPVVLGGPGKEVQIDESLLVKAKYFRGHALRRQDQWIFGVYDVTQKMGYMTFVEKRDAATLLPIIERVVAPGTIIISDEWAAYRGIVNLPQNYTHHTVNHSRNFVNPADGSHTNHVESYWKSAKAVFNRMNGTAKDMIPGYLQ